jgi:malate dehydrogenase
VRSFCPDAVVLVATNPIDVFTYVFAHLADLPPERVIGYSWNDSLRLRWAVAAVLGVPVPDVEALVLGEHGDGQVPLFDRVTVRSQPVVLTPEQRGGVEEAVRGWFTTYQGLQSGRTSGWTSAVGIGEIVRAIASASPQLLPCSAILRGQYGLREVSLGVPVRLGPRGVRQIEELPLTEADLERLHAAARKVRAAIAVALGVAAQQGAA